MADQTLLAGVQQIQGIAGGVAVPVTVDTSALSKDATITGGTQTTRITDGVNGPVAIETAGADGVSNTANALVTKSRLKGFNGATWDRIRSGITACTATLTGVLNTLPWAVFNAAPTTRTEGQGGPLQAKSNGDLAVDAGVKNGTHIVAITPSDNAQAQTFRALLCLTSGNCYLKGLVADSSVCVPMIAGQLLLGLDINFVMSTGPTSGTYAGIY